MSFTKVAPAGIGTSPGTSILIGDSLLHSTGIDIGSNTGVGVTIRQHGDATFTGIVTAASFSGNITGKATELATNATGTNLTLSGNLGVGGVITYEDVTNVDAVGVITARSGINLVGNDLNVGSNIKLGNASGIVTATSFVGGLPITNGADNRVITASSATAIQGESGLTYDGADLNISNNTPQIILTDTNSNNSYGRIRGNGGNLILSADHTNATGGVRIINFEIGGSEKARITSDGKVGIGSADPQRPFVISSSANTGAEFNIPDNNGGLSLNIYNRGTTAYHPLTFNAADVRLGINAAEKVRLASTGQFLVGTATPSGYSNRLLTVGAADNDVHIEIRTANDHAGTISFSDTNAGNSNAYSGYVQYNHSDNHMAFGTSSAEKVRIDTSGNLCVGITGGSAKLHTKGEQSGGLIKSDAPEGTTRFFVTGNDSNGCEVNLYDGGGAQRGILVAESGGMSIKAGGTPSELRFNTTVTGGSSARRFLIDEYGASQIERGSNGWSTLYHKTNNGGTRFHYRPAYTGASSANINLIRIRRHYWGGGHYKIKVRNTYYNGSAESHFWISGHAANGATNAFSINHNNVNNGNSSWIQKTATSHSSPGNNYSGWIDVYASVSAYHYYDIIIEASGMPGYSQDITSLANDGYALHPV